MDFDNLRRIYDGGHVAVDDMNLSARGVGFDGGNVCVHDVAGIKADADERTYAVIHIVQYTRPLALVGEAGMMLTMIAARLREVAAHIDALPLENRESDVSDELVPKFVMNVFVEDKLVEGFRTDKKKH